MPYYELRSRSGGRPSETRGLPFSALNPKPLSSWALCASLGYVCFVVVGNLYLDLEALPKDMARVVCFRTAENPTRYLDPKALSIVLRDYARPAVAKDTLGSSVEYALRISKLWKMERSMSQEV